MALNPNNSTNTTPRGEKDKEPLLGSTGGMRQNVESADIMIMFKCEKSKEMEETFDGTKFIDDCYIDKQRGPKAVPKFDKVCRGQCPTKRVACNAFIDDFIELCFKDGLTVKHFMSADEDEIFLRISINSEDVSRHYADVFGMRLQTSKDFLQVLKIKQTPEEDVSPCYIDYDADIIDSVKKDFANSDSLPVVRAKMYKKYYLCGSDGVMFRHIDRVKIINRIIERRFDVADLKEQNIIEAYFPVHSKFALHHFKKDWANFSLRRLLDPTVDQPLTRIRDYFGEPVAFYFAWLGYTIRRFFILALFAAIIATCEAFSPMPASETQEIKVAVSAAVVVCWGSLYTLGWKRYQHSLAAEWDTLSVDVGDQVTRAGYRGDVKDDPLNENLKKKQFSRRLQLFYQAFGHVVTFIFMWLVLVCVGILFYFRPTLIQKYGKMGSSIVSYGVTAQIAIFGAIWTKVAKGLVHLENPRTKIEYINRLVWKLFLFGFLNSYNSFLYMALFQKIRSHDLPEKYHCPDEDCLSLLRTSLATTYATLGAMAVVAMAQPYLTMKWQLYRENKKIKEKRKQTTSVKRAYMEKQGKMWDYAIDDYIGDFLALIIAVGYALLFAAVVPLVVIIALVILIVRLRADAWKLCNVYRRTMSFTVTGIGAWNDVLEVLTWIGLLTTVAVPVLNLPSFDDYTVNQKFLLFFGIEHLLVVAKMMTAHSLSDVSARTQLMLNRRAYVEDALREGKQESKKVPSEGVVKAKDVRECRPLNEEHPDWSMVELDSGDEDKIEGSMRELSRAHDVESFV